MDTSALQAARDRLLEASTVEEAAEVLLDAVLRESRRALRKSPHGRGGKVLRGLVHLRPQDGYRGLYSQTVGAAEDDAGDVLPSATTWRWVESAGLPVEVNVAEGRIRALGGEVLAEIGAAETDSFASRQALLQRAATHLIALPLRLARGRIAGMLSIELRCTQALGADSIELPDTDLLQLLADLAAGVLVGLPLAPAEVELGDPLLPVVGQAMKGLVRTLRVFSAQPETLLILGPTGVGKSRLARWCHERSGRGGEFVSVDLLTLPEDMQMPELFGWKRGAFTGAVQDHAGAVFLAEGGTLFLDEIDKLSLKAQAGLLTFLESRQAKRMGEPRTRAADVRVIVGSNQDLREAVAEGRFREDLYYRINVLPIRLPSLDERRDEIVAWAEYMVTQRHAEGGLPGAVRLAGEAGLMLQARRWPGNLRQLNNVVRRSYALSLVDLESPDQDHLVQLQHVQRALQMDGSVSSDLVDALRAAAIAFADRVARAPEGAFDLSDLEAFKGAALEALIAKVEDRDAACVLLGMRAQVESRNHQRLVKRELGRWEALVEKLRG